jgi:hypothetical protein
MDDEEYKQLQFAKIYSKYKQTTNEEDIKNLE